MACLLSHDLLGLDLDVGDLAADLAVRLVDHDLRVRQGEPLALGAAGQQDRGARGGHADAVGRDRALDELHRVVDRQRAGDAAARAVDVEADALGPVLVLEEQELHHGQVGHRVVDHAFEEDDPVLEEQVAEGHLALRARSRGSAGSAGRRADVRRAWDGPSQSGAAATGGVTPAPPGGTGRVEPDRTGSGRCDPAGPRGGREFELNGADGAPAHAVLPPPGRGRRARRARRRDSSCAGLSRFRGWSGLGLGLRPRSLGGLGPRPSGRLGLLLGRRRLDLRGGRMVQGLDRLLRLGHGRGVVFHVLAARMRSMTFRSRIWVVSCCASPSFSSRERIRRGLSPLRSAIASISTSKSSSSTLISSASAILARRINSLSDRRVASWALARIAASLARISLSVIPSWRSCMTSRRIVLASSRPTRSAGRSNGVRSSS